MFYQKFGDTYLVRLERGEEILSTLKSFCQKEEIRLEEIHTRH